MHTLEIQLRLQRPSESCLWQQKDEESDGQKVVCTHTRARILFFYYITYFRLYCGRMEDTFCRHSKKWTQTGCL